jgi:outer membrane protein TolC
MCAHRFLLVGLALLGVAVSASPRQARAQQQEQAQPGGSPEPEQPRSSPAVTRNAAQSDSDLDDPDYSSERPRTGGYTLTQCLKLSESNFPKVLQARAKVSKVEAQLDEARYAPFSEFTATGGLGVVPSLRGTSVYSPDSDVALSRTMGFAWQVGFEGVIPLWTFGKIGNLVDAAKMQVKAGQHEVQKEKNELRLSVRQAYYGLQLATDALYLVRTAAKRIEKYLARMEAKGEADVDDVELLKVKMHRAELTARESEAIKQAEIARAGLAFFMGVKGRVEIRDQPLQRMEHHLVPLARYLAAARLYRPEINMARAGVLAREAQLRQQRARYYPDLGLGLTAGWNAAPGIDDQQNPFVRDSANYLRYAAGLVMRWKLDFLSQSAREAQAEAELEAMRASEQYALGGVGVEVQTAFQEAIEAERRLAAYTEATRYAKRWLVIVQQGIDIGTYDDEDIVDPAREYALKRFARMQATFDYNMALSRLAQATGWDSIAPAQ